MNDLDNWTRHETRWWLVTSGDTLLPFPRSRKHGWSWPLNTAWIRWRLVTSGSTLLVLSGVSALRTFCTRWRPVTRDHPRRPSEWIKLRYFESTAGAGDRTTLHYGYQWPSSYSRLSPARTMWANSGVSTIWSLTQVSSSAYAGRIRRRSWMSCLWQFGLR